MDVCDLILKRRTIRRFMPKAIPRDVIVGSINAARLAPSAMNLQPLEFILVTEQEMIMSIFNCTNWAGYAKEGGPKEGEEPGAFIVIISNHSISRSPEMDVGLAAENIMLYALSSGVASCPIVAMDKDRVRQALGIPQSHSIEMAIALGYPKQESVEDVFKDTTKYWVDGDGVLHVPKRNLEVVMHEEKF